MQDWRGYPQGRDLGSVELLWAGGGVPPERTWAQRKYYGMVMGYSPVNRQTPVKTIPPIVHGR